MSQLSSCCAIIVTYNGGQWIKECLESLLDGTAALHIYVVDNCSTDNTVSIVKSFPKVILKESETNLGFGGANNLALKEAYVAGHEYFFLVNQDTRVEGDTVEELVRQVESTNHNAIICPIQLDGVGKALDRVFESVLKKNQKKFPDHSALLNDFRSGNLAERYEVKIANAAFWMLNRKLLEKVGTFHPYFFHYGEDANYWDRARYLGFEMVVAGKALACHDKFYKSRRHQSASGFFEKELLKILLDPNKERGFIHIIFSVFSGAEIVFLNKQYKKIPTYLADCFRIYKRIKSKIKNEVDLKITIG